MLVGDSFVWGQGVEKEERFGDVLESLYVRDGAPTRVYSLGQKGFGLPQYVDILGRVPASVDADRVVVAFYMNDMPAHETLRGKIQDAGTAVGRACPSARLVGDKVSQLLTPDVDAYHAFVVESWNPDHPTYGERWQLMEERVRELGELARERTGQPPVLLILPLMVDFADYPLDDAHGRIARLATEEGSRSSTCCRSSATSWETARPTATTPATTTSTPGPTGWWPSCSKTDSERVRIPIEPRSSPRRSPRGTKRLSTLPLGWGMPRLATMEPVRRHGSEYTHG